MDLDAGTPEQVWRKFFATHRPAAGQLSRFVLGLHRQRRHEHVIAAINESLIAGQSQPWMYDVLALTMQIVGRPRAEIERVLLSRIDFTATDVPNMLLSAAYLTRFGADRQALTLYRQASRISPTRPEPYALGLKLAERLQDHDAIRWAATGTLTYTWPTDYRRRHQAALDVASDAEAALRKSGQVKQAEKLAEAVAVARQRDLVVTLSWNGPGELDLRIQEPLGTVCDFDNRQTRSGGALVHDGFGPVQQNCFEEYVCAFAAAGEYRLVVDHVDGEIVGKRGKLTIRRYVGTDNEQVHTHPVVLDSRQKVVRLSLQGGRRVNLSDALPTSFTNARRKKPRGRPFRFGPSAEQPGKRGRRRRPVATGYTPVVSMLSEGVANTALAVVSGDRRYVRLTVDAVFTSIIDVATFSFRR
ncbi:MAG: hypothetical protein VB859_18785 [Planctomycetaceae bacterium]